MNSIRLTLLALAFSSFAGVSLAQPASDHNVHHPADAPQKNEASAVSSAKPVDAAPLFGEMDAHMENMQKFHQKFLNVSPEERRALMAEHHTMMQEGMKLMGAAAERTRGAGMMGMSDMMGGMGGPGAGSQPTVPSPQMAQGMMQHHELMSKRMDMMQSMMQMMMDRMDAAN